MPNSGWRVSTAPLAVLRVASNQMSTRYFGVSTTTLVSGTIYLEANGNGGIDGGG